MKRPASRNATVTYFHKYLIQKKTYELRNKPVKRSERDPNVISCHAVTPRSTVRDTIRIEIYIQGTIDAVNFAHH